MLAYAGEHRDRNRHVSRQLRCCSDLARFVGTSCTATSRDSGPGRSEPRPGRRGVPRGTRQPTRDRTDANASSPSRHRAMATSASRARTPAVVAFAAGTVFPNVTVSPTPLLRQTGAKTTYLQATCHNEGYRALTSGGGRARSSARWSSARMPPPVRPRRSMPDLLDRIRPDTPSVTHSRKRPQTFHPPPTSPRRSRTTGHIAGHRACDDSPGPSPRPASLRGDLLRFTGGDLSSGR